MFYRVFLFRVFIVWRNFSDARRLAAARPPLSRGPNCSRHGGGRAGRAGGGRAARLEYTRILRRFIIRSCFGPLLSYCAAPSTPSPPPAALRRPWRHITVVVSADGPRKKKKQSNSIKSSAVCARRIRIITPIHIIYYYRRHSIYHASCAKHDNNDILTVDSFVRIPRLICYFTNNGNNVASLSSL